MLDYHGKLPTLSQLSLWELHQASPGTLGRYSSIVVGTGLVRINVAVVVRVGCYHHASDGKHVCIVGSMGSAPHGRCQRIC